jgi:ribosomal-protein-serine acetyltransferase
MNNDERPFSRYTCLFRTKEAHMFRLPLDSGAELRFLEPRHAEALYELAIRHRDHLRAWLPWAHADYTLEDTRAFVECAAREFVATGAVHAGIWLGGEMIGYIGLRGADGTDRRCAVEFWMSEDYQGRGHMRAAFRAAIAYAFEELGLNRVEFHCASGNSRSRSFPERSGFAHEGTLRQAQWLGDRFVDLELYSLLAHEWRGRK